MKTNKWKTVTEVEMNFNIPAFILLGFTISFAITTLLAIQTSIQWHYYFSISGAVLFAGFFVWRIIKDRWLYKKQYTITNIRDLGNGVTYLEIVGEGKPSVGKYYVTDKEKPGEIKH